MRLLLSGLTAFGILSLPAFAEGVPACPPDAPDLSIGTLLPVSAGKTKAAEVIADFSAFADLCPDEAYVQLHAAEAFIRAASESQDPDLIATRAFRAWDLLERYAALPYPTAQTVMVGSDDSPDGFTTVRLRTDGAHDLRKNVLRYLLVLDAQHGKTHPDLAATGTDTECHRFANADVFTVQDWYERGGTGETALRLASRRAEACRQANSLLKRTSLAYLAMIKINLAKKSPDAVQALALLEGAQQDANAYLQDEESGTSWSAYQQSELDKLLADARFKSLPNQGLMPREDWLKPEHIGSDAAKLAIAVELDKLWQPLPEGEDADKTSAMTDRTLAYATFLGHLAKEAEDQGVKAAGWQMLYTAAKGHADGLYRTDATRDLPAPPDYLYNYLNKAPAD